MRKVKFIIIIIFISGYSSLKYSDTLDRCKDGPKEIEITTFKAKYKDSLIIEELRFKEIYYFDSKGRKTKKLTFKSDGTLSNLGSNYKYDKKGNFPYDIS